VVMCDKPFGIRLVGWELFGGGVLGMVCDYGVGFIGVDW